MPDVAIVIAALNEADNMATLVRDARQFGRVIVVNDGSTNGTGGEASMAGAAVVTHLHSTHIKAAYRDGFKSALRRGFEYIVQMDAGFSHDPRDIPSLLAPEVLETPGLLDDIQARAHAFQFEMTYRIYQAGFNIVEVPITYVAGRTSVKLNIILEALATICRLGRERLL